MTDTMFDAGKNARRETNAIKGWIEEKLPFWDEVIDVEPWTNQVQISRFPGRWSPVFNRIMPEIGGYVLVIRVADEFLVMGPPPEEETQVQTAPEDPIDAEEGQIYKIVHEDDTFTLVTVVETPSGRVYREVTSVSSGWNAEFAFQFSGPGSGFTNLRGVTTDDSFNVYTSSDHQVDKFTNLGVHEDTIATGGSGDGEVDTPWGLAYSSTHAILAVANYGNGRLSIFQGDQWLKDISDVQSGPAGVNLGSTVFPWAWTTEPDSDHAVVWALNPGPDFDFPVPLGGWSDPDLFQNPVGVAMDSVGRVWIVDSGHNKIHVYTNDRTHIFSFGTDGSGPGQFSNPQGIDIDERDNVYVADTGNHRIQVFDTSGVFRGSFGGLGSGPGKFNSPSDVAITQYYIYVADSGNDRVQAFTNPITPISYDITEYRLNKEFHFGSLGGGAGQFLGGEIHDIAIKPSTGQIYVVADGRITKFGSNGTYISTINPPTPGMLTGIAFDSNDNFYVTDETNNKVLRYNSSDTFYMDWGSPGLGPSQFSAPSGIDVVRVPDGNERVYVSDRANNRILAFTTGGLAIPGDLHGSYGNAPGQMNGPRGISVSYRNRKRREIIVDTGNHRIQRWSNINAGMIWSAGGAGRGPGQFWVPRGVATDYKGNIFVTDTENHRISVFDDRGIFIGSYGSFGSESTQFKRPIAIAISNNYIYVGDTDNHRIQVFTNPAAEPEGEFITITKQATTGVANSSTVTYATTVTINEFTDYGGTIPYPLILPEGTWEYSITYAQTYYATTVATWGAIGRFNGTLGPSSTFGVANLNGARASFLTSLNGEIVSDGVTVQSFRWEFVRNGTWAATPATEPGYMTITFRKVS